MPKQERSGGMFASPRALSLVALVLAGTLLHAQGVQAKTFVVVKAGRPNCAPEVGTAPTYPSITAALAAVPIAANAAHVVLVCPGTYMEQLRITKNVTIRGALRDGTDPASMDGNSNEAVIAPPTGGLVPNAEDIALNVVAQVSARNITDLNLTNLSIDGTGIGCPLGATGLAMPAAGIALYNVGVPDTNHRATISKTVVHNQVGICGVARSYKGDGIFADESIFTLDANSLSNADLNVVHQRGGISKITNNYVNYGWHGIYLNNVSQTAGATSTGSTVSSNMVTNFTTGIYLDVSSNVLVSLNTVASSSGEGIALLNLSTDNAILSNKIIDAEYSIFLTNGAIRTDVRLNTIFRAYHVAITSAFSEGGNVIGSNTIQQAPVGVFIMSGYAADVVNPNTYYNTGVLTSTGTTIP